MNAKVLGDIFEKHADALISEFGESGVITMGDLAKALRGLASSIRAKEEPRKPVYRDYPGHGSI